MMNEICDKTEDDMSSCLLNLDKHLNKIRTGRVNLKIFDSILVDSYQKNININQLASIMIINNNTVKITPWDKNNLQSINKAIINSNLGVNPSVIDDTIKINFPPMNEERRIELIKNIKKIGENSKITIRNIRRDKNNITKKLLKNKDITKDEEKNIQDQIQSITNKFITEVDQCLKKKEIELMKI
jgi:ribosome recycling factor